MPTYPLVYRITDYLQRQIAWSEAVIAELDAFCKAPDEADVEPVLVRQQQRERETREMAREYRGLASEWATAKDVTAEEVAAIKALSHQAETLMARVREHYDRAEAAAQERRGRNQQAYKDLRRGRRSVNIYRPGALAAPGFLDKKA